MLHILFQHWRNRLLYYKRTFSLIQRPWLYSSFYWKMCSKWQTAKNIVQNNVVESLLCCIIPGLLAFWLETVTKLLSSLPKIHILNVEELKKSSPAFLVWSCMDIFLQSPDPNLRANWRVQCSGPGPIVLPVYWNSWNWFLFFSPAQSSTNPEWEGKVTEYFREKLKENNATNWVRLCFLLFALCGITLARRCRIFSTLKTTMPSKGMSGMRRFKSISLCWGLKITGGRNGGVCGSLYYLLSDCHQDSLFSCYYYCSQQYWANCECASFWGHARQVKGHRLPRSSLYKDCCCRGV